MRLTLNLIDNNNVIQQKILTALLPDCKKYLDTAINKIKAALPNIVYNNITNTQEYISLISGQLKFEFGIPDASQKIASLIDLWITNIVYTYKSPTISGNQIKASFTAELVRSDFSDVLGSEYASVQDQSGYSLPWLRWLLLDGSAILVPNHSVIIGPNPRSRTGNAIMRMNSGQSWSVPNRYQGTESDNWITRALDNAAPDIENLINGAMAL